MKKDVVGALLRRRHLDPPRFFRLLPEPGRDVLSEPHQRGAGILGDLRPLRQDRAGEEPPRARAFARGVDHHGVPRYFRLFVAVEQPVLGELRLRAFHPVEDDEQIGFEEHELAGEAFQLRRVVRFRGVAAGVVEQAVRLVRDDASLLQPFGPRRPLLRAEGLTAVVHGERPPCPAPPVLGDAHDLLVGVVHRDGVVGERHPAVGNQFLETRPRMGRVVGGAGLDPVDREGAVLVDVKRVVVQVGGLPAAPDPALEVREGRARFPGTAHADPADRLEEGGLGQVLRADELRIRIEEEDLEPGVAGREFVQEELSVLLPPLLPDQPGGQTVAGPGRADREAERPFGVHASVVDA